MAKKLRPKPDVARALNKNKGKGKSIREVVDEVRKVRRNKGKKN